jgi:hypothetical protein
MAEFNYPRRGIRQITFDFLADAVTRERLAETGGDAGALTHARHARAAATVIFDVANRELDERGIPDLYPIEVSRSRTPVVAKDEIVHSPASRMLTEFVDRSGLLYNHIARRAKISPPSLTGYLRNVNTPSNAVADRLSTVLGLTTAERKLYKTSITETREQNRLRRQDQPLP